MEKELIWQVFIHDFNENRIKSYNVFDNGRFLDGLKTIKKEMKKLKIEDKDWFCDKVCGKAMNAFWCKSEYEIVMDSIFERSCETKVDVFCQLSLNWNQFIDYIWENLKLIKVR